MPLRDAEVRTPPRGRHSSIVPVRVHAADPGQASGLDRHSPAQDGHRGGRGPQPPGLPPRRPDLRVQQGGAGPGREGGQGERRQRGPRGAHGDRHRGGSQGGPRIRRQGVPDRRRRDPSSVLPGGRAHEPPGDDVGQHHAHRAGPGGHRRLHRREEEAEAQAPALLHREHGAFYARLADGCGGLPRQTCPGRGQPLLPVVLHGSLRRLRPS